MATNNNLSDADKVWDETGDVRLYLDALRDELEKKRSIHTTRSTRKQLSKFSRDRQSKEKLKSEMVKHERFMQRSQSFLAFVTILESKGLPAHVIDEERFSEIISAGRWDEVPAVLCHMIRADSEVKTAFKAFEAAAQACSGILPPKNKAGLILRRVKIAEMYRDTFMQAASTYARKLSALEASLDRLSTLTLDQLESLATDEDELSKRLAAISIRISDEIKRREGKAGGDKANSTFRSLRAKVFVWLIDHYQDYKDRKALDEAASEIEKGKVVVGRSWRKIREDITEYGKLNQDEVQRYIAENLKLRTTRGE